MGYSQQDEDMWRERASRSAMLWPNVRKVFQPLAWSEMTDEEQEEYCLRALIGPEKAAD